MSRVRIALFAAPVLVGVCFGPLAVIALPVTLLFTGVVALPLFCLFKRRGWLRWWHAVGVGIVCGALFEIVFALGTAPDHTDFFGPADALTFCGVGAAIALLFWWLGLFRNEEFPSVPTTIPWGMVFLIPLVVGGVFLHNWFNPTFHDGRVTAVTGEMPHWRVTVRLSNGSIVILRLDNDDRPTSAPTNQCWHLMEHWSTKERRRVYSLLSPFGDGFNDC
jgi:hypothetical protein